MEYPSYKNNLHCDMYRFTAHLWGKLTTLQHVISFITKKLILRNIIVLGMKM